MLFLNLKLKPQRLQIQIYSELKSSSWHSFEFTFHLLLTLLGRKLKIAHIWWWWYQCLRWSFSGWLFCQKWEIYGCGRNMESDLLHFSRHAAKNRWKPLKTQNCIWWQTFLTVSQTGNPKPAYLRCSYRKIFTSACISNRARCNWLTDLILSDSLSWFLKLCHLSCLFAALLLLDQSLLSLFVEIWSDLSTSDVQVFPCKP